MLSAVDWVAKWQVRCSGRLYANACRRSAWEWIPDPIFGSDRGHKRKGGSGVCVDGHMGGRGFSAGTKVLLIRAASPTLTSLGPRYGSEGSVGTGI